MKIFERSWLVKKRTEPRSHLLSANADHLTLLRRRHFILGGSTLLISACTGDKSKAPSRSIDNVELSGAHSLKPTAIPATGPGMWEPSLFPDEVLFAYQAGDMAGDAVAHAPVGLLSKPSKAHSITSRTPAITNEGLVFNKNQYLLREGTSFGATMFRGFLIRFKLSDPSKTGQVHLVAINVNSKGKGNTPRVYYSKGKLIARWDALTYDGTHTQPVAPVLVEIDGVITDGETWNTAIVGRHDSFLFNRLNGSLAQGPDLPWSGDNNTTGHSIIGPRADQGDNIGVVIGDLIGLQGELSEEWYSKAEGWLAMRGGRRPFHGSNPPVYETSDHPHIHRFDLVAHDAWVAANPRNAAKYRAQSGRPALPLDGYTRVYLEDFRVNTVGAGGKVNTFSPTIYAQGANPAVGGDEGTKNPFLDDVPTPTYDYKPGALTLYNEYREGKWRAGALSSVSNSMHGRSWAGGYVFRWRTTSTDDIAGKLFWGMWGYCLDFRRYHHIPRKEIDFNEPDAVNRMWGNWFSVHNHEPFIKGRKGAPHHKLVSQSITKANGWPADLDHFSGKPVTCEVRVDPDFIYLNIDLTSPEDMSDRTNLKEWMRFPTPPGFLERWYFMINTCIKNTGTDWEPDRNKRYGLTVHGIEVWQRDEVVNAVPAVFAARPVLTRNGDILTVDAKLRAPLNFVEYVWIGADGYQYGITREPRFQTKEKVKALVRAIGATDLPEAWSNIA